MGCCCTSAEPAPVFESTPPDTDVVRSLVGYGLGGGVILDDPPWRPDIFVVLVKF